MVMCQYVVFCLTCTFVEPCIYSEVDDNSDDDDGTTTTATTKCINTTSKTDIDTWNIVTCKKLHKLNHKIQWACIWTGLSVGNE